MLRSIKELQGYTVLASDGDIGTINEFYFDDHDWIIRYLVVDTGDWLPRQKVLISPVALRQPDWEQKLFPVKLTKAQVENSPDIDTNQPISRRHEAELHQHYQWPIYWTGSGLMLNQAVHRQAIVEQEPEEAADADPHLRSTKEVIGYHIQARDGEIGHVEDFVTDDETWSINYMIVDTQNWLPGRKVLVSPNWIEAVSWLEAKVHIDLSQETIENSPEYDPSMPVDPEYEDQLHDYYGRTRI